MRITTRQTVDPPKTLAAQPHQSEGECAKYKGFYPRKVNNETNLGPAQGIPALTSNIILTPFPSNECHYIAWTHQRWRRVGWVIIWWSQTIILCWSPGCTLQSGQLRMSSAWPEQRRATQNFSDSQSLVANRQQTLSREGGTSFYPHRLIALYSITGFTFTERPIVHDDLMTVMTY